MDNKNEKIKRLANLLNHDILGLKIPKKVQIYTKMDIITIVIIPAKKYNMDINIPLATLFIFIVIF